LSVPEIERFIYGIHPPLASLVYDTRGPAEVVA
jgi:hypothetical protein